MIPRDWEGQPAVVIASGPSLVAADVDFCRGKAKVAAVSDNYRLAPWADLLYAADWAWWDEHDGVIGFQGEKWACEERVGNEFGANVVRVDARGSGFSTDPSCLHRLGGNSGGQCLNLVLLRGANPVYLLGFDMQPTAGRKHWFGDHPKRLNRGQNFAGWRQAMDAAYAGAVGRGQTIINCSRETALTAYPRASIADCL